MTLLIRLTIAALATAYAASAHADRIRNPTSVFSGLDKITGRIITFEVAVDETVQFGALQITPKVCWSRPPTEAPQTTTFLEVDEVTLTNEYRRIFTGWMFASSPGLHGVEHPIYDVWLTECKGGTEIIVEPKEKEPEPVVVNEKNQPKKERKSDGNNSNFIAPNASNDKNSQNPVQPSQQPAQRFFPTNNAPSKVDPAGSNR